MLHAMVSFDELVLAEKRSLIRKILLKIAEYYATLDNPIFKEFSAKNLSEVRKFDRRISVENF